jgi:penicillin-binding protein 1A
MSLDPTEPGAEIRPGSTEEPDAREEGSSVAGGTGGASRAAAPTDGEPAEDPVRPAGDPADPPDSAAAEPATTAEASGHGPDGSAERAGTTEPRPRFHRFRETAGRQARVLARSKLFWAGAGLILILVFAWQRCGIAGCPNVARLASYQPGGASVLLDRRGEPFADLRPVEHAVVEIESLPKYVPAAFVAVEDKRFYHHNGVDWRRVAGAFLANLKQWRVAQGSSTIAMQLSRNLFPERIRGDERTLSRKLMEVRVARDIERRFTKDEILELYLNHIYFGAGAYGIEAASRQYFGRSAKDLTLEQAATLAALPKAPTNYDPRRFPQRSRTRRDLILTLMAEQERVDADKAERARAMPIRLAGTRTRRVPGVKAAYFVQTVRDMLEDELGEELYSRPLRIRTTIDLRAQSAAEQELERQIRRVESGDYGSFSGPRLSQHKAGNGQTEYLQGSVVVLENGTGDVLALVGGRDARHSTFNRAVAARRQAGSAFKPFVYATALARGYAPARVLDDSPYRLVTDGRSWEPNNYDGEFLGEISLRDALVYSRNVPTIRLAHEVGERNVARLARAAGISAELRETPMIALGIAEVSPLELTTAYTAFSGQGEAVTPRFVLDVKDAKGKPVWAPPVERRRVMDSSHAYMMTDLLRDVVEIGTGRSVRHAGYRGLAAGKTGTTNDGADTWFVGYTNRVTAGVWVGFDKPRPIAEGASGGSIAAYAWGRMMTRIAPWAAGRPWEPPDQIIEVAIDPETGLKLAEGCVPREGEAGSELFVKGRAPREICPERRREPGAPSWTHRLLAWAGDLLHEFTQGRDVRLASRERPQDEDRTQGSNEPEWTQPFAVGRSRAQGPEGGRPWRGGRWQRPAERDWAADVARSLQDALEEQDIHEERALEWLRELTRNVERNLDGDARAEVAEWLEDAVRSIEDAARDTRRARGEVALREEIARRRRWN